MSVYNFIGSCQIMLTIFDSHKNAIRYVNVCTASQIEFYVASCRGTGEGAYARTGKVLNNFENEALQ